MYIRDGSWSAQHLTVPDERPCCLLVTCDQVTQAERGRDKGQKGAGYRSGTRRV